ncbi:MAG: DPP IV N-terminal domain-containing protein [Planctomycetes bacterium]|nr:DPP IV N-terminal domain-containing protein [Planctomycetota bacterium]MBL7037027.1 DPP IV N-terminal domain-containing protein [Pirellulaceae bacterium]
MKTSIPLACFLLVGSLGTVAVPDTRADTSQELMLKEAEARLRAIYDRDEFRARRFRADWLSDSSGYTILESVPNKKERVLVCYDAASGKRTVLDPSQKEKARRSGNISPDGQGVISSEQGNLYVRDLSSGRKIPLTNSVADSPVSNSRAVWSPDGQRIAFVQSDDSGVKLRSVLVPGDPTYPRVSEVRYARVGEAIPTLRVGVVDAEGKETRWLPIAIPAEGFYLGQVDWAGNSHELLIEKLSRFRDEREFLLADVRTGAIRRIFHESDPAWVIASYGKNAGLTWIRGGQAFIVLSEKDGWRHAYVYSRDGQELYLLTPGHYDIIERAVVDEAGGWFYYYASPDNATQKHLYRVRLDGTGEPERVTPLDQPGTHDYDFSPDARWAFHAYSTFDTPPITELVQLPEHQVVRTLEDNQELRAKMESMISQPTEFLQLEIGDGVVMDAWMIKPEGFDPSRKYPVLVYVYGEPHAQTVLDAWGKVHADYHRLIADLGYLVVSIDNRGTPAPKGAAWRRAIFGSLGPLSTEEQAAGVKELARTRPYVDLSRLGVWGWSGGGSNTLNAMFRRPDVYHVGIAVAPKPQPHLYNAWFQEIYMETRETNPDGYRRSAPINFADGLKGDLLIIHGTGETNTHLQITEGLVDRLIELGKQFDYMAYPNRDHGLREGRGTAVHLRMLMTRYLLEHLPPGPR